MALFARRTNEGTPRASTSGAAASGATSSSLLAPELMARVRQIQIRTHRLVNTALSGGYRSTFRGSGIEFQEVRAYQPGDEVRRIDWNVTARTGEPFIKNYAEERELTIHLLVDTSPSMDFGSRHFTKREVAAQFAALISFVAMRHQDRVGLSLFGGEPGLSLRARKGGQHVLRVVREVIAAPVSPGTSNFVHALENVGRALRRRSVVFVISDFLGAVGPEATAGDAASSRFADVLARLNVRHDVIAVRVHDPLESELPSAGWIELEEIESGRRLSLDTRSRAVREEWLARATARRNALVAALARGRVDKIELDTAQDVGRPVLAFFRRRALVHGGSR